MNQNILFPDLQQFDAAKLAVCFQAQQAGALIPCYVAVADLEKRAQQKLETEEAILAEFSQHRFDLEELAELAIEEEDFNVLGEIWVR